MLDEIFIALSHPVRRAILQRLRHRDAGVNELVALFDLTQPSISTHLKMLERAGLVTRYRDAQFRYARLNADTVTRAIAWLSELESAP